MRLARGDERFTELYSAAVKHPEPGEVIFVDDGGVVIARRWCWRQSAQSGASEGTIDVLEACHESAEDDVKAALGDLAALLAEHAGGAGIQALLSPERPELREG